MSAYLVQPKTIANILVAHIQYYWNNGSTRGDLSYPDKWLGQRAKLLAEANVDSVNHRYGGERDTEDEKYIADVIKETSDMGFSIHSPEFNPVQIIKSCHCLNYQSCEVDGWEQSKACELLNEIIKAQTYILPGYDEAEWG